MQVKRGSSPRTWGCFLTQFPGAPHDDVFPTHVGVFPGTAFEDLPEEVFPTHVGVFLIVALVMLVVFGLPHARGGVSYR